MLRGRVLCQGDSAAADCWSCGQAGCRANSAQRAGAALSQEPLGVGEAADRADPLKVGPSVSTPRAMISSEVSDIAARLQNSDVLIDPASVTTKLAGRLTISRAGRAAASV